MEEYDNLPQNIKDIIDTFDDNQDRYKECGRIQERLEEFNWTCDWGLDGDIYDVRTLEIK